MKTQNYELFKFRKANRPIDQGLVQRLKESIKAIGYIESRSVLVNQDFEIIDGQHRFMACKELKIPIIYSSFQMNGNEDQIIVELNKNQVIWRLEEYIQFYAAKEIECYVNLLEFKKQYKIDISQAISIYFNTTSSPAKFIRQGKELTINPKANEIAQFIRELKLIFPFVTKAHFARASVILFKYAEDKQIQKLFDNRLLIFEQPSVDTYLILFENIINRYSKTNKVKLRR